MRKFRLVGLMLLLSAIVAFAACGKKEDQVAPTPKVEELSIFSWWTAGGEAEGLNELIALYEKNYPNVKIVNAAVAGGAGTNAKAVLKTRMLGGDAPGTFQVHGGAELLETWVKPKLMAPITPLFNENNLGSKFPIQLLDMVGYQGEIYAVPANIHRGNMMWFNKKIFDDNGITPPTTIEEWLTVCEKLKEKGITPIALGSREKWPVLHLFENLLLAAGDADFYNALFEGKIAWTDPRVQSALDTLQKLVKYSNDDHAALTWDQACAQVQQGKAAMTVMGDWAKGYFLTNGAQPGVDFDAAPTPGTVGSFFVITDTFGLPEMAPNRVASLDFLRVVASIEGQVNFNLKKGSIPARTDAPMDQFDAIAKRTMEDFKTNALVPSCAHGSAVIENFVIALNDQLSVFIAGGTAIETAEALEVAAKDAKVRVE